jgi:hypothetical protein
MRVAAGPFAIPKIVQMPAGKHEEACANHSQSLAIGEKLATVIKAAETSGSAIRRRLQGGQRKSTRSLPNPRSTP